MKNSKRAAIYMRVSTEEQIDNYSLDAQKERLENYCQAMGYTVYKAYTDPGWSGGNVERPAMKSLIQDAKDHKIDVVVVYKLDRLSRSQRDTLFLIEDVFAPNGVAFVSMTESFDTSTPMGKAMVGILSVFAQLEREQIKERMIMGMRERIKAGKHCGPSESPIGYSYDKQTGLLSVDEYEAMQVREIFDLVGNKHWPIQRVLNHIQNKGYTNRFASYKSRSSLYRILNNRIYIGDIKYSGEYHKGLHEPIIAKDLWDQTHAWLNSKSRQDGIDVRLGGHQPFKPQSLLNGLLVCGDCGENFLKTKTNPRKDTGEVPEWYKCKGRHHHYTIKAKGFKCDAPTWRMHDLDDYVVDAVRSLSISIDNGDKSTALSQAQNVTNTLKTRIKAIEGQQARLIDLYQVDTISLDAVKERTEKLETEKNALITEIEASENSGKMTIVEFRRALDNFNATFGTASLEDRRAMLQALIDKIVLTGRNIEIFWHFSV